MSHKKTERNKALLKYHQEHPRDTLKTIGGEFKISGVRVYQILKGEQEVKRSWWQRLLRRLRGE